MAGDGTGLAEARDRLVVEIRDLACFGRPARLRWAKRRSPCHWLFTNRGRVLPQGHAPFFGDTTRLRLNGPILDSVATPSGRGYYLVGADGGGFAFGDAAFLASMRGRPNQSTCDRHGALRQRLPDGRQGRRHLQLLGPPLLGFSWRDPAAHACRVRCWSRELTDTSYSGIALPCPICDLRRGSPPSETRIRGPEKAPDQELYWSGRRDSNPRPQPWQGYEADFSTSPFRQKWRLTCTFTSGRSRPFPGVFESPADFPRTERPFSSGPSPWTSDRSSRADVTAALGRSGALHASEPASSARGRRCREA